MRRVMLLIVIPSSFLFNACVLKKINLGTCTKGTTVCESYSFNLVAENNAEVPILIDVRGVVNCTTNQSHVQGMKDCQFYVRQHETERIIIHWRSKFSRDSVTGQRLESAPEMYISASGYFLSSFSQGWEKRQSSKFYRIKLASLENGKELKINFRRQDFF